MDKEIFLQGKSLRQISRESGKSFTTVRYWKNKYKKELPQKTQIIPDDKIAFAVKSSNSCAHALRILGRSLVGSNYLFLKKHINRLNLDISHWMPYGVTISKSIVPWEKILVENSLHHFNSSQRKRLVKEKLLEYICYVCNSKPVWNNKPLTLRLDHKNGKNNDNRLSNLGFICPNCDSQLPTYCGKNKVFQRLINSNGQE